MDTGFKQGDLVRCVDSGGAKESLTEGKTYMVQKDTMNGISGFVSVLCDNRSVQSFFSERFILDQSKTDKCFVKCLVSNRLMSKGSVYTVLRSAGDGTSVIVDANEFVDGPTVKYQLLEGEYREVPAEQHVSNIGFAKATGREDILNAAKQAVMKDRNETHGEPEDSFKVLAALWSAYLGIPVTEEDAAILLGLLKIARLKQNKKHEDNWVDLAGYAACGGELALK